MRTIPATVRMGMIAGPRGRAWLGSLLHVWIERRRQRRMLARLDAHLLDDIGLSSDDVAREAGKPFWRP